MCATTRKNAPKRPSASRSSREYTGYYYDLFPRSKEMLLEYRDLVARNGSKLLVFIYPNLTVHNLAIPGFLDYNEALMRFCKENDIECVNFSLARPELYPRKTDEYYFDLYHMVGEGSDIFSYCFSKFFNCLQGGRRHKRLVLFRKVGIPPVRHGHPQLLDSDLPSGGRLEHGLGAGRADRQRRQRKRARGTCIWPTATTALASRRNTASSFATNPRERKPR